jgi:hypothetical protein
MFEKLKAAWNRLSNGTCKLNESATPLIEYNGYRIRPTPYAVNGHVQQFRANIMNPRFNELSIEDLNQLSDKIRGSRRKRFTGSG